MNDRETAAWADTGQSEEQEWISKKELLAITGISYGQLYRWKRERLIPDSWFVKRSAVTGQETYLPRKRVLERIRFIQEHRDTCPLNRMQELLDPGAEARMYSEGEMQAFPSAGAEIALQRELAGRRELTGGEALCAILASQIRREGGCGPENARDLLRALNDGWNRGLITKPGMTLLVLRGAGEVTVLALEGEYPVTALGASERVSGAQRVSVWKTGLDDRVPRITSALRSIAERED